MRTRRGWRAPALFVGFDRPVRRRRSPVGRGTGIEVLEDRTLLAVNPIVDENLLPGNPRSEWDVAGAGDTSLQGFATDMSVDQGTTISFKINDASLAAYHIDIYRMGYYGGLGARKVVTISSSATQRKVQPAGKSDPNTGLLDCGNWSISASWAVPTTAVSGVYIARLVRDDTGGASHIPFVVRDDDGQSDVLYQTSDSTWQAYNNYGGNSLYEGSSAFGAKAVKVSYNRPWNDRAVTGGLGANNWFFWAEYPMVRWLEQNGYNVSYFTDVDSDRLGSEIREHKLFLSVGHDEYWSGGQRANVEAARDAGVNLAFFSGNESFWKTRWENSIDGSGTPYRTLVCYKETQANAKIDPLSTVWTGTWRDPRFSPPADGGRPENSMTGTIFTVNRGPGGDFGTAIKVPQAEGQLRLWRNTSVATLGAGQTATLANGTLGYEWDEDLDNGARPAGLIRLSSTVEDVPERIQDYGSTYAAATATHSLTLYRAASGALVFGAGTVQWSFGLDATHDGPATVPDVRMRQATVNLFADMNVQPGSLSSGLTLASASTDALRPTSIITSPLAGAALQVGVPVTINGTANDTGGGIVAAVEVSTDGGLTWHRATGRTSWSYTWTPTAGGAVTLRSRAVDDSVNLEVPTAGTTVNVSTANTLVAAYGFDAGSGATAVDSSGRGNNGAITGATWTTGRFGGALAFNGSNQWVTVADASSLDLTTGMTLEAWVRPNALNSWTSVLLKENGTTGLSYSIYANQDVARPATYIHVGNNDQSTGGIAALPLNTWSHLAATYDGASLRFYVNGTLVNTAPVSGSIAVSTGALRIGGNAVWGEYFNGLIDEVRIYNRPLAQSEIQVDMNTPISVDNTPPTVGAVSPVNNATGVDAAANVTAQFSEALDPATVAAAFELRGPGNTLVPAAVSYNSATRTATLDPTASLALATTYTARVRGGSTGVKDLAGNPLAADFTWTFTTVAAPLPTLSVSDVSVTEGNSGTVDAVFNVTLSAASTQTVTVTYATANGTATAGSDYTALAPTTLTFAPGETSKQVVVTVNGDTTVEGNETFFLNLSAPTNATLGDAQGQGTIVNDDSPPPLPTLSVSDVSVTEGNSGTVNAVFNVTLSAASTQTVTVTYATANGTATAGSDYTALAPTTLTFAPGETSKQVVVTVNGDTTVEGNETFFLNLSAPTNATLGDAQGQGTIVNDDAPLPTLAVSDVSVTEGNTGTVNAVFNVALSAASTQTVTVTYATANGTATAGSDYIALAPTTLTFAPGETSKQVVVTVLGDTTAEGNETFFLNLSAPTNATLGDAQGQGTIVNDDSPPPSTGLVAAYGFNEGSGGTAGDVSGNGLNGALANATWSTAGRFGNALSFNGSNAMVTVNDANALDLTGGMTLEAWVNPASTIGWRSVILKERPNGLAYALYSSNDTNQPPAGYINRSNLDQAVVGTSVLPLNTWTHLATSFDGSALRLYVNGTLVQTNALSGKITTSNRPLQIGGNTVWGEYFSGLIDEVRVYNRALSQTEIQTDMNAPVGGGPAALDAARPAGTGSGTPAGDSVLTAAALDPLVAEAAARWRAVAPAGTDLSPLAAPSIRVADLPGTQLGWTADGTIWLDRDAAGFGWFLDPTPGDDREFTRRGNQGEQGRIDLLSALAHEMGHLLGFSHDDAGVMAATLSPGVRTASGTFVAQGDGTAAADQGERNGEDGIAPGADEETLADLAAELIRSRAKRGRLVADRIASLARPGAAT